MVKQNQFWGRMWHGWFEPEIFVLDIKQVWTWLVWLPINFSSTKDSEINDLIDKRRLPSKWMQLVKYTHTFCSNNKRSQDWTHFWGEHYFELNRWPKRLSIPWMLPTFWFHWPCSSEFPSTAIEWDQWSIWIQISFSANSSPVDPGRTNESGAL